jgi:hypothetical protein
MIKKTSPGEQFNANVANMRSNFNSADGVGAEQ